MNTNKETVVGVFVERDFDYISKKWVMHVYFKYENGEVNLMETFSFNSQEDVDSAITKFIAFYSDNK